ncbi:MAG TPA: hypothetical protein VNE71_15950, partial [Myxococcota bacterium]|nr:hypothetical protein [Myxococcota bacterium]
MGRSTAALVACVLALAPARSEPVAPAEPVAWRSESALPGMREGEALAFDPASGRIALGDGRGVWLLEAAGTPRRVLGRGPVRDLRFRAGGELLAATDRGLFAIGAGSRVRFLRLGGGKASRARRVAVAEEAIAAGTEDGVFLSRDGQTFARLPAGSSRGTVRHAPARSAARCSGASATTSAPPRSTARSTVVRATGPSPMAGGSTARS